MNIGINKEQFASILHKFDASLKQYQSGIDINFSELEENFMYVCPLCLEEVLVFFKTFYQHTADFDMDHFPPESVGGKKMSLVCKKCNNTAGTTYDYLLKEKIEYMEFMKRRPGARAKVNVQISNVPGRYKSHAVIDEKGDMMLHLKDPNKKIAPLDNWLRYSKINNDWTMNLEIKFPDPEKVNKAILKTAYLYCFDTFGYEFALSVHGKYMREAILGVREYDYKNLGSIWIDDLPDIPEGVCFVSSPLTFQNYVVNIPLTAKDRYKAFVLAPIPAPTEDGSTMMKSLDELFAHKETVNIQFKPISNCINNGMLDGYSRNWQEFFQPPV